MKSKSVDMNQVNSQADANAQKQQQYNTQSAQTQAAYNRPNQTNAFGNSVNWVQTGTDANGDPMFSQNQSLGALGQQYAGGLSNLGQQYMQTAGQGSGDSNAAFDRAYSYASANLEPRMQRAQDAMDAKLRNQGLDPSSEAYKNRMNDLALQQNEARNNLVTGLQGQMFTQGLQGRQQQMSELSPGVQFGFNNALNTGQASYSPINVGNIDYGSINNAAFNQQNSMVQAENQRNNAMLGGLAGLGGAFFGGPLMQPVMGSIGTNIANSWFKKNGGWDPTVTYGS
jgi:hypothetical protein